jgi:type II secretory pathway component GspD/PulD (secretin)
LLSALVLSSGVAAKAETPDDFYQQWVDYRDGEISLTFERIPVQFALYAIHAKTGLQIIIPQNNTTKTVNLRLDRQPFEPAMRSLISTIGYKNFALMYDDNGRPNRAVVLAAQRQPEAAISTPTENDSATRALSAEEQAKLHKDLARWSDLKQEERGRIEDRLKNLPPSEEREQLVKEYGQQVLGLSK